MKMNILKLVIFFNFIITQFDTSKMNQMQGISYILLLLLFMYEFIIYIYNHFKNIKIKTKNEN